jgi:glycosyltransferase involved in cell wall biosynthesis
MSMLDVPPAQVKRVLMTADTVGGVWTYAIELARALRPLGVEVALATMGDPLTTAQREEARSADLLALVEGPYRLEWMADPWRDVAAAGDWLLGLEHHFQPDVVHLNQFAHGALPWTCPRIVVAHSCVRSWWHAVHGADAPAEWDRYRHVVTDGLRGANRIVAPSQAMLNSVIELYGPLPKCQVIYNGRALPHLRPRDKQPLILSAGRLWDPAKNVAALAAASPDLDWPIYVAGEMTSPDNGEARFGTLHGLGRLGAKELLPWFERAAIYALPARYEPFGLSALEAAIAGCALVLGDIPSLREIWDQAAVFVPPDDPSELRAALQELIVNPPRRQGLAAEAQRRAAHYRPERMAAAYCQTYREVLAAALPRHQAEGLEHFHNPVPRAAARTPISIPA